MLTYFLPRSFLCFIFNPILGRYRRFIIDKLAPEIKKYRQDSNKKDSLVLRGAVDFQGGLLTDKEIGEVIICLLYVSSENTALGLSAAITDLALHSEAWNKVSEETKKYLINGDIKSLFATPYLDACVMESARMNTYIFPLVRQGVDTDAFGGYYIGDADCVALCEPLMMLYDSPTFKEPLNYRPERFIGNQAEPKTPKNVMTWGAGMHLCPGKRFSVYEIKTAMALITNTFEIFKFHQLSRMNYFCPSAFAERDAYLSLKPLPEPEQIKVSPLITKTLKSTGSESTYYLRHQNQIYPIQVLKDNESGHRGWLLRHFLSTTDQEKIYTYIVEESRNSKEHRDILTADPYEPYPLAYYNLIYTWTHNCEKPMNIIDLANEIWNILQSDEKLDFPPIKKNFNSVYA